MQHILLHGRRTRHEMAPADNAVAAIQRERNGDVDEIVDGEITLEWFGAVGIS